MPRPPQRVWDSNVIIDYLSGAVRAAQQCPAIIGEAERGEIEIVVSTTAETEVVSLDGSTDQDAELRIREFFSRVYILRANVDSLVGELSRQLVRDYPRMGQLLQVKPKDAVHVATALRWRIPVLETFDDNLIDRIAAEPHKLPRPLELRHPTAATPQGTLFDLFSQRPESDA